MVEPEATFFKPTQFDDRLSEVSRRIEELNLRQGANMGQRMTPTPGQTPGNNDMMPREAMTTPYQHM